MEVPYTVEARPDTGVNNLTLGIWLFLASEVMLFGGLFSAYVALRGSGPAWRPEDLRIAPALVNTIVLLTSGATMAMAMRAVGRADVRAARLALWATAALGFAFLCVKSWDYSVLVGEGAVPATSTFFAVFFLLTGAHALHVLGGVAVILFFAGTLASGATFPIAANRLAAAARYWFFVDAVWIVVFAALYLL